MKKSLKLLFLLAFAAFSFFAFLPKTNSVNAESLVSKAKSKAIYTRYCANCHGADGSSNTAKGRELEAPVIKGTSVSRTIKVVTNGDGDMPAFKKKLTKAQITAVANYVRGM